VTSLLDPKEVVLYDKTFRLADQIQESLVSVFPGRVVIGDPTRADDPLASSYVMSDWTGGLLKSRMDPAVDFDRFRWSTGATWFSQQLSIGQAVGQISMTGPQTTELSSKHVRTGAEYGGSLYAGWDDKLVRVNADDTITVIDTLPNIITHLFVYRNMTGAQAGASRLVIAYRDGYKTYNGTTVSAGTGSELASYLEVWDDKLVKLGYDGVVKYVTDVEGTPAWTLLGVVPLPSDSVTGLLIFPDGEGADALHVVTTKGLYFYDDAAGRIRPTRAQFPPIPERGRGSTVYEDNLYMTGTGMSVYRYTGPTISKEGLDRDDGLPSSQRGKITKLTGVMNFLAASAETMSEVQIPDPVYPGSGWLAGGGFAYADTIYDSQGFATIYGKSGTGWHTLYSADQTGSGSKWLGAASTGNKYRLWFGLNGTLYFMNLFPDVHNIIENNLQEFRTFAVHQTPFNHCGWAEIDKLALQLDAGAERLDECEDCKIIVEYALNENESTWTVLGEISDNVPPPVFFGANDLGLEFRSIAFRFRLERCSITTHSPILRFATLKFLKSMDTRWGYRMTIDCTQDGYQNLTSEEQYELLKEFAGTGPLGRFKGWVDGRYQERKVKVATMSALINTGDGRTMCNLSLVSFNDDSAA
jgi:hypothetical protein